MDHERAFLQAIREEPDDDAHRLIYADWLEEQGGAARTARAAFIRAQCRLAVLPPDDPNRDALEDEAADLLAEHEREWTQPLHGLAVGWGFSRGFPEYIFIHGENFLANAERLFAFAPLRELHLPIGLTDVPHLAACSQLQRVEMLDLGYCNFNDRSLQQLLTSPYLSRLTALELPGNGINTPGIQTLTRSPVFARLTRLDLKRNLGIGDKAVNLLARAAGGDKLRTLNLAYSHITNFGVQTLFQSSQLTGLRNLNLSGSRIHPTFPLRDVIDSPVLGQLQDIDLSEAVSAGELSFLLASPGMANLQKLSLRGIHANNATAESLAKSAYLSNLTTLDLRNNRLGAEGARTLADSPHLAGLTWLDLSSNNIRDAGAKALVESPHLKRLTVLDLSRNGIGGPGLKALASSANLELLTTLRLAGNFTGVESVRALAESPHLRRLTLLDLHDAYLEGDSAAALASSPNLPRLSTLFLSKNLLGDAGARALAQSPYLRRLTVLDLNDNRIGKKAGAEALAAAPVWRLLRTLGLRGNVFTDTQETLLRDRFGDAVQL